MTFQYCFDGSIKKVNNLSVSSPRTWGCFQNPPRNESAQKVFPTHVGVFQNRKGMLPFPLVFPTHVGVFLLEVFFMAEFACLPHARGGVSRALLSRIDEGASSPRTWGCFFSTGSQKQIPMVFPTHVGVFPRWITELMQRESLPHARGGVSTDMPMSALLQWSSPRTWGCFSFPV